jgi:cyclophilin family peptidyl-prolyl cis-trans isomerase
MQMGDISNNDGSGHVSHYDNNEYIKDEIDPSVSFCEAGVVAMANKGRDTNGSQFFITFDDLPFLNNDYTIIGQVVAGYDVAKKVLHFCGTAEGVPKCTIKISDTGIYKYDDYMKNKALKF